MSAATPDGRLLYPLCFEGIACMLQRMRILLVEDDTDLGEALVDALSENGFDLHWARDGEEGLYEAQEWDYDLIVLDRMLPGMDGLEILKRLRVKKKVPVLMLTALSMLECRLEGFADGADDYLGKPFELPELLARIRALLRRSSDWVETAIVHGEVRVEPGTRKVFRSGREVALTASEFATVELLLSRRGRPISKLALEDRLHGDGAEVSPNALEVHIHRIRGKLGKDFIQTRRGVGYVLAVETDGGNGA